MPLISICAFFRIGVLFRYAGVPGIRNNVFSIVFGHCGFNVRLIRYVHVFGIFFFACLAMIKLLFWVVY